MLKLKAETVFETGWERGPDDGKLPGEHWLGAQVQGQFESMNYTYFDVAKRLRASASCPTRGTAVKLAEVKQALSDGGTELDMVVNISLIRSGNRVAVTDEIRALTESAHGGVAKSEIGVSRRGATRTATMMEDALQRLGFETIAQTAAVAPSGY